MPSLDFGRIFNRRAVTIQTLKYVQEDAAFVALRNKIRDAGTDRLRHFKNGYAFEGGLALQQNPDEFAALCLFLTKARPIRNYIEIGVASGGTCRFLRENVGFDRAFLLDDGKHPRAKEQGGNLASIENLRIFIGDSHSPEAQAFLAAHMTEKADVAFIDGDHSYEGVQADIDLVLPFCKPGTLLILHDTVACSGVKKAWRQLTKTANHLAEYIGAERPLGIGIAAVR